MKVIMRTLALVLALALAGCATSSVVVGKVRPPISPAQVKIYLQPPAKYEQVAIVESSSQNSWAFSSQGQMNHVMQNLKEAAAKLGANGVLINTTGTQAGGYVMVPAGAGSVALPGGSIKTGTGVAIFVPDE